ncbi:type VII toxin-antitoxin system MntA family adenylyltransferase antitoxin [Halegenticoccus soli]|uniref:type VII toxin-antitoxin system MntA family adenylyltransferase antitoxin n=1 Tax=Halegenticoccus soli TaxID=1985678 RepID=UPI000C6D74B2
MGQPVNNLPSDVREAVITRLEEAPVSLALLFGSYATGRATIGSDVDIAVEYDDSLEDLTNTHLSLVTDLTRILGRDDVDVVRITSVDPRIAVEALEQGELLIGTDEDAAQLRDRLEPARKRQEELVQRRIEDAERTIQRRLQRREHG